MNHENKFELSKILPHTHTRTHTFFQSFQCQDKKNCCFGMYVTRSRTAAEAKGPRIATAADLPVGILAINACVD